MSATNKTIPKKIAIIFMIGLCLRLFYVLFFPQIEIGQDSIHYYTIAHNVAERHTYSDINGKPDVYWAPGYPLFLSAIYMLFGANDSTVRIIQAILSALIVLFVYYICVKVFNERIAVIAAAISCIHPGLIGYSGIFLPQLLSAFLLVFFIFLLVEVKMNMIAMPILGLIAGYAVLARAELLLFFPCLLALSVYWPERKRGGFKLALVFLIIMILVVSIWSVRNFRVFGRVIPVSVHLGDTLWISSWKEEWLEWQHKEPSLSLRKGKDAVEVSRAYFKAGIENIKEHPFIYGKMCVKRSCRLWVTGYSNSFRFMQKSFKAYFMDGQYTILFAKIIMLLFNMSIVIVGFLGIPTAFSIFSKKKKYIWYLVLPILFLMAVHFFIYATPRYAISAMPFVIIFASVAIHNLSQRHFKSSEAK